MFNQLKYRIRDFLSLNKTEQRAVIILSILVIAVVIVNATLPYFHTKTVSDHTKFIEEIAQFRHAQLKIADSLKLEELQNKGQLDSAMASKKIKPFPFDPNILSVGDWTKMGLSQKQIQNIENYKSKGGKFATRESFKKLYSISEVEYNILEPYILLPQKSEIKKSKTSKKTKKYPAKKEYSAQKIKVVELNSSDSITLLTELKIPDWLVRNLITYRQKLGGFYEMDQLSEVYGFDTNRFRSKRKYVTIDTSLVRKIDLNQCTFKQLVRHPYVSYELTREIMDLRLEKGSFSSLDFLLDDSLVTDAEFRKLKMYLVVK